MSDVVAFYSALGVELRGQGTEASVRCFANPDAHTHGDRAASASVNSAKKRCWPSSRRFWAWSRTEGTGPARRSLWSARTSQSDVKVASDTSLATRSIRRSWTVPVGRSAGPGARCLACSRPLRLLSGDHDLQPLPQRVGDSSRKGRAWLLARGVGTVASMAESVATHDLTAPSQDGWAVDYRIRRADGEELDAAVRCWARAHAAAKRAANAEALAAIADRGLRDRARVRGAGGVSGNARGGGDLDLVRRRRRGQSAPSSQLRACSRIGTLPGTAVRDLYPDGARRHPPPPWSTLDVAGACEVFAGALAAQCSSASSRPRRRP